MPQRADLRIAHVMAYFAPAFCYGGPPRTVYALCEAQARQGAHVEVFTTTANGEEELTEEARAACAAPFPIHYFDRAGPKRVFFAPRLAPALAARVETFDVVHLHGLWNATVITAARVARRAGVPYVISPRGMLEPAARAQRRGRKAWLYALVQRRQLANAALVHASSAIERDTIAALGLPPRVALVPNGVALDAAPCSSAEARRRFGLPGDAPIVLFVGRLHPIKRLDLLAAAFVQIRAARPDAHLVIAGPDETGQRALVERWLGDCVSHTTFTGHLAANDARMLMNAANVLVQCSDSESFGLSVAEALAASVPVVVTRTCPWEAVERERCGRWVAQDARAIAGAALDLLNDSNRAREFGARGRALVEREYSWPAVAARLLAEYDTVVQSGRRRPVAAAREVAGQSSHV